MTGVIKAIGNEFAVNQRQRKLVGRKDTVFYKKGKQQSSFGKVRNSVDLKERTINQSINVNMSHAPENFSPKETTMNSFCMWQTVVEVI